MSNECEELKKNQMALCCRTGSICEQDPSQAMQELQSLYNTRIRKIEECGDYLPDLKIKTLQKWIQDLNELNATLLKTVHQLENEAIKRVEALNGLTSLNEKKEAGDRQTPSKRAAQILKQMEDDSVQQVLEPGTNDQTSNYVRELHQANICTSNENLISNIIITEEEVHNKRVDVSGSTMSHDNTPMEYSNATRLISKKTLPEDISNQQEMEKQIKQCQEEIKHLKDQISIYERSYGDGMNVKSMLKSAEESNDIEIVRRALINVQQASREMQSALTAEVAEKHDTIVDLKREVSELEEKLRQSDMQTHFRDDIIKQLRKEVKIARAKESLVEMLGLKESPQVQLRDELDRLSAELEEREDQIVALEGKLKGGTEWLHLQGKAADLEVQLVERERNLVALCNKMDYVRNYLERLEAAEEPLSLKCGLRALLLELTEDVEWNKATRRSVTSLGGPGQPDVPPPESVIVITRSPPHPRSKSLPNQKLDLGRLVNNSARANFKEELKGLDQQEKLAKLEMFLEYANQDIANLKEQLEIKNLQLKRFEPQLSSGDSARMDKKKSLDQLHQAITESSIKLKDIWNNLKISSTFPHIGVDLEDLKNDSKKQHEQLSICLNELQVLIDSSGQTEKDLADSKRLIDTLDSHLTNIFQQIQDIKQNTNFEMGVRATMTEISEALVILKLIKRDAEESKWYEDFTNMRSTIKTTYNSINQIISSKQKYFVKLCSFQKQFTENCAVMKKKISECESPLNTNNSAIKTLLAEVDNFVATSEKLYSKVSEYNLIVTRLEDEINYLQEQLDQCATKQAISSGTIQETELSQQRKMQDETERISFNKKADMQALEKRVINDDCATNIKSYYSDPAVINGNFAKSKHTFEPNISDSILPISDEFDEKTCLVLQTMADIIQEVETVMSKSRNDEWQKLEEINNELVVVSNSVRTIQNTVTNMSTNSSNDPHLQVLAKEIQKLNSTSQKLTAHIRLQLLNHETHEREVMESRTNIISLQRELQYLKTEMVRLLENIKEPNPTCVDKAEKLKHQLNAYKSKVLLLETTLNRLGGNPYDLTDKMDYQELSELLPDPSDLSFRKTIDELKIKIASKEGVIMNQAETIIILQEGLSRVKEEAKDVSLAFESLMKQKAQLEAAHRKEISELKDKVTDLQQTVTKGSDGMFEMADRLSGQFKAVFLDVHEEYTKAYNKVLDLEYFNDELKANNHELSAIAATYKDLLTKCEERLIDVHQRQSRRQDDQDKQSTLTIMALNVVIEHQRGQVLEYEEKEKSLIEKCAEMESNSLKLIEKFQEKEKSWNMTVNNLDQLSEQLRLLIASKDKEIQELTNCLQRTAGDINKNLEQMNDTNELLHELEKTIEDKEAKLNLKEKEFKALQHEIKQLDATNEKLTELLHQREGAIAKLQSAVMAMKSEASKVQEKVDVQMKKLEEENQYLHTDIEKLRSKLDYVQNNHVESIETQNKNEQQIQSLLTQLAESREKQRRLAQDLCKVHEMLQDTRENQQTELLKLHKENNTLKQIIENKSVEVKQLQLKHQEEIDSRKVDVVTKLEKNEIESELLRSQLNKLVNKLASVEGENDSIKKMYEVLKTKYQNSVSHVDQLLDSINTLQTNHGDHQGYTSLNNIVCFIEKIKALEKYFNEQNNRVEQLQIELKRSEQAKHEIMTELNQKHKDNEKLSAELAKFTGRHKAEENMMGKQLKDLEGKIVDLKTQIVETHKVTTQQEETIKVLEDANKTLSEQLKKAVLMHSKKQLRHYAVQVDSITCSGQKSTSQESQSKLIHYKRKTRCLLNMIRTYHTIISKLINLSQLDPNYQALISQHQAMLNEQENLQMNEEFPEEQR